MRGQTFLVDFAFSIAVFFVALVLLSNVWDATRTGFESAKQKNVLATISFAVSDSLLRSPGHPVDWTPEDVESVGLAGEGGVLNSSKTLRLLALNYSSFLRLTGLAGRNAWLAITGNGSTTRSGVFRQPIAYYSVDEHDLFDYLNNKNLSWDYYWGQGIQPEPGHGDARAFYSGARAALFNGLFENQSLYKTVVVEEPSLLPDEVNISAVQEFLDKGGLLVFRGDAALLAANLSMTALPGEARSGGVNQTGFFLFNVSAGESVSFTNASWAVYSNESAGDAGLRVFVGDAANQSEGLACSWRYGNGVVYFLSDAQATFGAGAAKPAAEVLNLAGWPLEYGVAPQNPENAFVVQKPCLLEKDFLEPCLARLVFWND